MGLCFAFVYFSQTRFFFSSLQFNFPLQWMITSECISENTHNFHLKFYQSITCLWQFHLPSRRISIPQTWAVLELDKFLSAPQKVTSVLHLRFLFYAQNGREGWVSQWERIHLSMQETWVWSLAREDSTCSWTTKPVHHNYWVCALELGSWSHWSPLSLKPGSTTRETTAMRSLRTKTRG